MSAEGDRSVDDYVATLDDEKTVAEIVQQSYEYIKSQDGRTQRAME
jgi:hypothetical protein